MVFFRLMTVLNFAFFGGKLLASTDMDYIEEIGELEFRSNELISARAMACKAEGNTCYFGHSPGSTPCCPGLICTGHGDVHAREGTCKKPG
jgi:hypothetical protein